jgi:hypothetical protein
MLHYFIINLHMQSLYYLTAINRALNYFKRKTEVLLGQIIQLRFLLIIYSAIAIFNQC